MKIGYFCNFFPSKREIEQGKVSSMGGASVVAYNLALKIGERGNIVKIFTISRSLNSRVERFLSNVTIFYYSSLFNIGIAYFSLAAFVKPLKQDLDIIHYHAPSPSIIFTPILYKKIKKVPLVVSYHGQVNPHPRSIIRKMGVKVFQRFIDILLSQADLIISPTARYIEESRLKDYKDKVVVIPNGVDIKSFDPGLSKKECREYLNLPLDKKILLYLNALVPEKGPDVLVKSMPKIIERVPEVHLVFVGKGRMRRELEKLSIKEGIQNHVTFAGFIKEGLKPLYYKASDIFVIPSTGEHESFGIVNLEAMASGLPIVASRIGGIPDIVNDGENGLLVPPGNPDALAEAIVYLLKNENVRENMANDGRKKVRNYSWDKIAEQTEKIYKKLITH